MSPVSQGALFLDRDGTLIRDQNYLSDPSKVEPLPGAGEALLRCRKAGLLLFLFTNQSGIGRGYFSMEDAEACNRATEVRLGLTGGFDEICIAPETPEDPPVYRKPSPRFILEMIAKHNLEPSRVWMIGDRASDVEAGLAADVHGVLIAEPNRHKESKWPVFSTVAKFVEWLFTTDDLVETNGVVS
ncbi:MAG: HAD-IIIA family hydrolase [Verrucomicrobiota bacterium]